MLGAILKATNNSFQKSMTFCRSIYVKKVMKLLAFIFEQPSYGYRSYCDILLKKTHKLHLSSLFCRDHTCYCVNMVSVTSASRYKTSASRYYQRYQSRSSMYIRGLILWNFVELAEGV